MVREFIKDESDKKQETGAGVLDEIDKNSISDIDFNPEQKMTNNFLGSLGKSNNIKDECEETAEANKAIIFKQDSKEGESEETSNLGSFCQ